MKQTSPYFSSFYYTVNHLFVEMVHFLCQQIIVIWMTKFIINGSLCLEIIMFSKSKTLLTFKTDPAKALSLSGGVFILISKVMFCVLADHTCDLQNT